MQEVLDVYRNTVTIFNYHEKNERWYSTVFPAAHLEAAKSASPSAGAGILKGDAVEMILPVSKDKSIKVDDTVKQYIRPKEYDALDDPSGYFTFHPERDFFAVGNHETEPVDDDDYDEGYYHAMNTSLDEVYMVSSAAFFPLLPHFEVGGR